MATTRPDALQTILIAYGFEGWASRHEGRRLRCPHGLLIGLTDECPVGCISPLVVMGMVDSSRLDLSFAVAD